MKKFNVQVTESISHSYSIEANTADEALDIYNEYNDEQLKSLDQDGNACWDAPWDISEE